MNKEQRRVATLLEGARTIQDVHYRTTTFSELRLGLRVLITDDSASPGLVWRGRVTDIKHEARSVHVECYAGPTFIRFVHEVPRCIWIEVDEDGYDVT